MQSLWRMRVCEALKWSRIDAYTDQVRINRQLVRKRSLLSTKVKIELVGIEGKEGL